MKTKLEAVRFAENHPLYAELHAQYTAGDLQVEDQTHIFALMIAQLADELDDFNASLKALVDHGKGRRVASRGAEYNGVNRRGEFRRSGDNA